MAELYDNDDEEERVRSLTPERWRRRVARRATSSRMSTRRLGSSCRTGSSWASAVRFVAIKNTGGFMRIAKGGTGSQEGNNKEILVVLKDMERAARRGGVPEDEAAVIEVRRPGCWGYGLGSVLAWAGSSLGPMIYPGLFRREFAELWSSLAPAVINAIPPQATRLQLVVDAGILRREDYMAELMEHVRGALEAASGEVWPEYYHVSMELCLLEPVRREEEGGDEDGDEGSDACPAKRRRVVGVAEWEECSLCLDPMESGGLAAWPGCRHMFHGLCVEQTLAGRATCPLCRHHLFSDALVC